MYPLIFEKIGKYLLKLPGILLQLDAKRGAERERTHKLCHELFDDLALIHGDYIRMFDDFESRLIRDGVDSALAFVKSRRLEFEPLRDKIQVLVSAWMNPEHLLGTTIRGLPPAVDTFLFRVMDYFPYQGVLHRNTMSSYVRLPEAKMG